ncbi:hypothetical protein [Enterococcus sp. BWR-S5]|uniref:hypothetical protein n=1 Tax=Enterococcus sp. BWR-S5 TaxID=2787714 RepID=UPI0019217281|nr:hypothetical protein [Enterococcus sp. BWR-S5]MBL1226566.1 hypothetical protein [Enterococcus sp. BWR-S5]
MEKQELLESDFRLKKRNYEEKEEEILFERDKGIQDLEEIADRAQYYLKDYVAEQEVIAQALRNLEDMKEEVYEAAQHDRKKIEREVEELEDNYYRDLRKLSEQESSKKEENF